MFTGPVAAQSAPLRVGMTFSQVPVTNGQPDQGYEGYTASGYTIYDALTLWKLDDEKSASVLGLFV